jgi:glycosyltransferase involved in cell wall biosynthesis
MNEAKLDISVVVPFKNKAAMTLTAVKSLLEYGPEIREILLISNNSNDAELAKVREGIATLPHQQIRVLVYDYPFNYQKINNWAVAQAKGRYVLFQNNDTELVPQSRGLIEKMCAKASKSNVGIVGCLLLYGDQRVIQHAGVFLLPRGMADHLYVGKKYAHVLKEGGKTKELPYTITEDRPMTAVTGAVNIVERKKYNTVHGFDERFIIGGGDVDLCIRLNKAGYQTWYIAGGYIVHKESQSRTHIPITYNDFYYSYLSYITAYDTQVGDPFLPEITKGR